MNEATPEHRVLHNQMKSNVYIIIIFWTSYNTTSSVSKCIQYTLHSNHQPFHSCLGIMKIALKNYYCACTVHFGDECDMPSAIICKICKNCVPTTIRETDWWLMYTVYGQGRVFPPSSPGVVVDNNNFKYDVNITNRFYDWIMCTKAKNVSRK